MVKPFNKKPKPSSVRASAEAMKALSGNKNYAARKEQKEPEEAAIVVEDLAIEAVEPVVEQPVAVEPIIEEPLADEPELEQVDLFELLNKEPAKPVLVEKPAGEPVVEPKQEIAEETTDSEPEQIISTLTEAVAKAAKKPVDANKIVQLKAKKKKEANPFKRKKPELVSDNQKLGLHICNLGKSYGGKPAVRDISIVVNRGEAVGLLGPNGAGKTTSFYMTMGLIKPDYGTIALDGVDITHLPVYRRARMGIGYLPQEASIFRGLTVEENILSVLELSEPVPEKRTAALESLLGEFSITHLRRSPAIALSGGERRRVEIARALASNPSFILLDEPLAGIDPVAVADIKNLISHLKNRGIGVLITDHNVREALDLLDRAYVIHDGTVLMEGTPAEIVNNKEVRRVYLGEKFSL
ncbi:MAG: lptB [Rickettsiaceae bacterium]|jgi:lipopolysaccharide export system ATP-binding protein|nr:lptB [Rickettsiaceae bacterium]